MSLDISPSNNILPLGAEGYCKLGLSISPKIIIGNLNRLRSIQIRSNILNDQKKTQGHRHYDSTLIFISNKVFGLLVVRLFKLIEYYAISSEADSFDLTLNYFTVLYFISYKMLDYSILPCINC